MPFFEERPRLQPLTNIAAPDIPDNIDPTLGETFGAAFRTQNVVGSYLSSRGMPNPYEIEDGFDAIDYVKDDPKFAPHVEEFSGIFNRKAADAKKLQIEREEQDRLTLDAAGTTGYIAQMAAGVVDLPTLLPVGGVLAGGTRAGMMAGTALGAGLDATLSEGALQATQATRTTAESVLNIGGSIVLGGALGALAGTLLPSAAMAMSRKVERQEKEFEAIDRGFAKAQSAGAASRDTGPLELKDEAFISKLPIVNRQDPLIRLQLGSLDSGRQTVRQLAETPLEYKANAQGVATERGGSVETRMKMWNAPLAKSLREIDTNFARYFHSTPEPSSWQRRLSPTMSEFDRWRGGQKMTYKQFKEEVGRAAYMGGKHEIPEVASAAKVYRQLDEELKQAAIDAKLFPEDIDVAGDISHRFRMYNKERIIAERGEFSRVLQDYFVTQRDIAAKIETVAAKAGDSAAAAKAAKDAEFGRLTDGELKSIVDDVIDTILGHADGRIPYDIVAGPRGALKERVLKIETAKIHKFTENDIEQVMRSQIRTMSADVELAKKFGDVDLKEEIRKVNDEANARIAQIDGSGGTAQFSIDAVDRGIAENLTPELKAEVDGILDRIVPQRKSVQTFQDNLVAGDEGIAAHNLTPEDMASGKYVVAGMAEGWAYATTIRIAKSLPNADEMFPMVARHESIHALRRMGLFTKKEWDALKDAAQKYDWVGATGKADTEEAIADAFAAWGLRLQKGRQPLKVDKYIDKIFSKVTDFYKRLIGAVNGSSKEKWESVFADIEAGNIGRRDISQTKQGGEWLDQYKYFESGEAKAFAERVADWTARRHQAIVKIQEKNFEAGQAIDWKEIETTLKAEGLSKRQRPKADFSVVASAQPKLSSTEAQKQRQQIEKARRDTIRDIEGIRDRLRGTYKLPSDPSSLVLRAGRIARNINYVRLLGGMTISAIPDMAKVVFTHGLTSTFRDGFIPMVRNFKAFRLAGEEVKSAGTALDMVLDSRTMAMADIVDEFGHHSKFERGLSALSSKFGIVSLMAPWNAAMKQFSGLVTMTNILKAAERVAAGKGTQKDITRLAASGIDEDLAQRIAKQYAIHGDEQDGVLLAKAGDWHDKAAREAFRAAVVRDVDRIIVTPGQDKPLWMSTELGKTVGQFKSFSVSSMQKTMLSGLQQRDAATLNGLLLMMGLGAVTYALKEKVSGRETSDDPAVWAAEAFDRSGISGWLMEANNVAEKATRGRVGLSALTGQQISRYGSRNVFGAFFGPTPDAVADIFQVSGSIFAGDTTKSDLRKARQLLPAQNLFYIRELLNQVEAATGDALGLPDTRKN